MKKKGSALILSILMLSFFMTITLTMYYIARNRNKRSIYKIQGMRISSGLDSGSAIAHYELYLADKYVSQGHLYENGVYNGNNESYPIPTTTGTIRYTTEIGTTGGTIKLVPEIGKHYTGIVLNNYNEYFGAFWDATKGLPIQVSSGSSIIDDEKLKQPWIAEDKAIGDKIVSRAWLNNHGEKIVRLWTTEGAISIGGYRLTDISGSDVYGNPLVLPIDEKILAPASTTINLTYKKIVSVSASGIGVENYKITYVEEVKVTPSGSSIIINSDKLNSMTVEKSK
jgi:hypothetical protein